MENSVPLVSIVIANYNYGRFLEEAIQSVLNQSCRDFELIVCDAASTDNSVDVIKKYKDKIAWWCSEKDGGQSAAFNKGFSHARGRFLTWLNADDVMLPRTIERLKVAAETNPSCEWFAGGCLWLSPEMRVIKCGRGRPMSRLRMWAGSVVAWGPSSFFTKRLLDSVGGVDERFHYAMDGDLWRRFAYKAKVRFLPFCKYAWGLRMHPDAKMSGHNFKESAQQDKNHPKWEQIRKEVAWMNDYYPIAKHFNFLIKLLSVSWYGSLMGRIDTLRYKRMHYSEAAQ